MTQQTTIFSSNENKIYHKIFKNIWRKQWSGAREALVKAGLNLSNYTIYSVSNKTTFSKMYQNFHQQGSAVFCAIITTNSWGERIGVARLNGGSTEFDLIDRCYSYCSKADFREARKSEDSAIFVLVSERFDLRAAQEAKNEYKADVRYIRYSEKDRQHDERDKSGYVLPRTWERDQKLRVYKAEQARKRFDRSQISTEEAQMTAAIAEIEQQIKSLSVMQLACMGWRLRDYKDLISYRKQVGESETDSELKNCVKWFNDNASRIREAIEEATAETAEEVEA